MSNGMAAQERAQGRNQLRVWQKDKLTLKRPVFFVPGFTDEWGAGCWAGFAQVLPQVCTNAATQAHWVKFATDDPKTAAPYRDFIEFGIHLAKFVDREAPGAPEVDFICHSMGGLDTLAALALLTPDAGVPPPNAYNVITFDTPFRGFAAADNKLFAWIATAHRKTDPNVLPQLQAMRKTSPQIASAWEARSRFLGALDAFWPRGAENYSGLMEVTHDSAEFAKSWEFDATVRKRFNEYRTYLGTSHSGKATGITNDARAIVEALEIVTGN